MMRMGYLMAAYGITLGTLLVYAISLARERARRDSGQSPRGHN